jgi:nucleotide-binding universal stress UspA family protein
MKSVQVEVGSAGYLKKEKAENYLAELEHSFLQDGIDVSKEFIVVEEAEADAIVKYAAENKCDLIALANQQSKGVGRWFFLNIEEKVKRRSSLPVLLVGGPTDKEKS